MNPYLSESICLWPRSWINEVPGTPSTVAGRAEETDASRLVCHDRAQAWEGTVAERYPTDTVWPENEEFRPACMDTITV